VSQSVSSVAVFALVILFLHRIPSVCAALTAFVIVCFFATRLFCSQKKAHEKTSSVSALRLS
jgi:uncharacterized membrane protein